MRTVKRRGLVGWNQEQAQAVAIAILPSSPAPFSLMEKGNKDDLLAPRPEGEGLWGEGTCQKREYIRVIRQDSCAPICVRIDMA